MTTPLRVLLVEDVEDDALLVLRSLKAGGYAAASERVEDEVAMRAALARQQWDLVLSDWSLPQFSALTALEVVKQFDGDLPFIIVSGTVGEETAVSALRAGALDFVLKTNLSRLAPGVDRALREAESRRARRQAEHDLRASEARYRVLFKSTPLAMWVFDLETRQLLAVNHAAVRQYGYSREEFALLTVDALVEPGEDPSTASHHVRKDGTRIAIESTAEEFDFEGRSARLVVASDVTNQRRLEEQLRQSQKMDAIGRLAGGIAHDFNNVLSVVLSYGEMLHSEMKPDDPLRDDVDEIRKAGKRAAELTRQLLMFSRQQVVDPKVVDLNDVLESMDKMLQRILGADVDLVSIPTRPLGRVRVDPSGVDQIIMNLVVNARDAMPTGGKLTMETANVILDEAYAKTHIGVTPGPHVMLAVSDTGTGMDRATVDRIFEPFFTTKALGKGTGLGLSTVFGIAKQNGGSVWVYSEIGKGTTFKVYLPRVEAEVDASRTSPARPTNPRGSETILLMEDDEQVRAVARDILERAGYRVLIAADAEDALRIAHGSVDEIHLLFTDVVMPLMSGPELARRVLQVRPTMKVLCTSGYTDDSIVRHGVLDAHFAYVQKPLTPEALTTKVRDVLDRRGGAQE